ncbi:N-methyl-L-tryptophan oxidase [Microvirga sp. 2YAF29]|uniref:N-methyl-L-tryptophan oxidase n=1 Tax=Microvirga sp. 2YAF29 TaxID=3233031 RepID=UPI003F95270D
MDNDISADVAVIGLGAMGSAALYQLARRGVKALGIDRFHPPHDQGSTHGETRITRQAIGEGEVYVPMAMRAHEIWKDLEAETGKRLLVRSGCLIVDAVKPATRGHIHVAFLDRTRQAAEKYGIAHEMLSADDIRRRFPQFTPREDEIGYFEAGGGYLDPERCVAAQLNQAQALGATMRLGTRVLAIGPEGSGVRIVTDRGDLLAGQAVVSAGPWAAKLLGAPFDRLLAPARQVMHWFEIEPGWARNWEASPVFIWLHGSKPNDFFYGFPCLRGTNAVKTAGEQYEAFTTPDDIERIVTPDEAVAMRGVHLNGRVQGLSAKAVKSATCLYTITPDSHFLIDHHPESDRILVVSPCSGHGFKHSAAIGEMVSQCVIAEEGSIDMSAFTLARFNARQERNASVMS